MNIENSKKNKSIAFAPASVGNVAVGFDILGFSLDIAGDYVTVERISEKKIIIDRIFGKVCDLPIEPKNNTAGVGLEYLIKDLNLNFGFKVTIEKGIPLGSGMGGSASSAVAAILAANELLDNPLTTQEMLSYAVIGEKAASGSYHSDNVAPSLIGGLVYSSINLEKNRFDGREFPVVDAHQIPIPNDIFIILVHPLIVLETQKARGVLKKEILLSQHIQQSGRLAGFICGCYSNNMDLLKRNLKDDLIEPQRAHLIPGFNEAKKAALNEGAIGCSISGAGPSVFAWAENKNQAEKIQQALVNHFLSFNISSQYWITSISNKGARIIK